MHDTFFACLEYIFAVCHRAQRDYLAQKLEEVDTQLREAKADRKESERDRRMSEAVDQLKRFFPGECRRQALFQTPKQKQQRAHLARRLRGAAHGYVRPGTPAGFFSAQPASRSPDMASHAAQPPCMPWCAWHRAQHCLLDKVRLQGVQHGGDGRIVKCRRARACD